ncbi:MAG: SIMPL domain-containing protein [Candidatus Paceibacterota bacterium]|jgi:hypothetical protein
MEENLNGNMPLHMMFHSKKKLISSALFIFITILSIYFIVKIINEIKTNNYIGNQIGQVNQISFSGKGEVFAVPDIANISFTARSEAKTITEAQKTNALKTNTALDMLRKNGIAEKDLKTMGMNYVPKYEYQKIACITYPCPEGKSVITGYTVSQTISVKIRNTDDTGKITEELAKVGITEMSGPDLAIDNEDGLKAEARKLAIDDAKTKAEILAHDLGVKLGKVISFNESGDYPVYYEKSAMMSLAPIAGGVVPEIPKGENKVTSNVTITYEIK